MIFVIDATDIERLNTASEELSAMLNEEELREAALLVFANKQDQPGAKRAEEISEALRLGELRDRNWSIVACSAVDGRGINEGMDWLVVSCSLFEIMGIIILTISAAANNTIRIMICDVRVIITNRIIEILLCLLSMIAKVFKFSIVKGFLKYIPNKNLPQRKNRNANQANRIFKENIEEIGNLRRFRTLGKIISEGKRIDVSYLALPISSSPL